MRTHLVLASATLALCSSAGAQQQEPQLLGDLNLLPFPGVVPSAVGEQLFKALDRVWFDARRPPESPGRTIWTLSSPGAPHDLLSSPTPVDPRAPPMACSVRSSSRAAAL